MDADEVLIRIGLSMESLGKYIRYKRWDHVPQPEGATTARYHYWKRDKIDAWIKQREAIREAKKAGKPANQRTGFGKIALTQRVRARLWL